MQTVLRRDLFATFFREIPVRERDNNPRTAAPGQTGTVILDDLRTPIVLAPMAGGPSSPELAAAVSRAGGLGFLGCAYSTPEQILEWSREVRSRTDRPF